MSYRPGAVDTGPNASTRPWWSEVIICLKYVSVLGSFRVTTTLGHLQVCDIALQIIGGRSDYILSPVDDRLRSFSNVFDE